MKKQNITISRRAGFMALATAGLLTLFGAGVSSVQAQFPSGYFKMTTIYAAEKGMVLEGNNGQSSGAHGGHAFMVKDYDAAGTVWKAIPDGTGYFYLTTQFLEGQDMVLEGSDGSEGAVMVKKYNASGLLWKLIDAGDGYYHLTTQFMESQGKILESYAGEGPAIMQPKANESGKFWKFTPVQ